MLADAATEPQDKINVFISYARDDNAIAEVIRNELVNFDLNRLDVFHDTTDYHAGEIWRDVTHFKLRHADWFIAIFTGKERPAFSYPGYEIGIFENSHAAALKDPKNQTKRIVCIYDTPAFPDIFSPRQNVKIALPKSVSMKDGGWSKFLPDSPIMKFLGDFTDYCVDRFHINGSQSYFYDARKRNLKAARSIITSFYEAQQTDIDLQVYTQRRMTIKVANGQFWRDDPPQLPGDTSITAEADTLSILVPQAKPNHQNTQTPYSSTKLPR